ncbi:biotin synthetase [Xylaria bambusicola]|uniref:biotin synthetase n=1 Tax=Xylaria bambusicola TaxID=326684 RepID=UPI0020082CD0|nr:biotin synthetase [Xylaria bambusicola]KAI0505586.1 biotin synthetase [Xylaria bambusicola]
MRKFNSSIPLRRQGALLPGPLPLRPRFASTYQQAIAATSPRTTWTRDEISEIYNQPLMELAYAAGIVHRRFHKPAAIQLCTLMNIKTGGCTEDCSYCAQSSRYKTGLEATKLSTVQSVLDAARIAKENGSNRFCMGAAWREMKGRKRGLQNIIEMIKGVRALGMEACVTLGMLDKEQAMQLKEAGLTAYNHNLDTSREHYSNVITTRTYDERLQTLENVRDAGIHVCSGGILGLGEVPETDHVGLIHTLATLPEHPESFPVNKLVPIKGTPMFGQDPVKLEVIVRCIATARLVMPATIIRLAAGRVTMPESEQMLCFMAGANAIFTGEKMLTTDCNSWDEDKAMFDRWGLAPLVTNASNITPEPMSVQHGHASIEEISHKIHRREELQAHG